jgi:hypothetical protein
MLGGGLPGLLAGRLYIHSLVKSMEQSSDPAIRKSVTKVCHISYNRAYTSAYAPVLHALEPCSMRFVAQTVAQAKVFCGPLVMLPYLKTEAKDWEVIWAGHWGSVGVVGCYHMCEVI